VNNAFGEEFSFSRGLEQIWSLIAMADRYIVEKAPWKLARAEGGDARQALDDTLYTSAEVLRLAVALLEPVLPESAAKIWSQLGMAEPLDQVRYETLTPGGLAAGQKIGEISGVFPRLEMKAAIAQMQALEHEVSVQQAVLMGKTPPPPPEPEAEASPLITIDDFAKVDLRCGIVLSAERVKGADKLLHLKVDIGEPEPRSIVAGIAQSYGPEEIVGKRVTIVANLQPRKLRGIPSQGMIVAASMPGDKSALATFAEEVPPGARLK
ncbi:MAG: methionine--tRNA ligase subunit beta, partial [Bryobacterales bacterium]|nr:methionine--tRNA ligase subunit beta [Bryobacterales bacterium]